MATASSLAPAQEAASWLMLTRAGLVPASAAGRQQHLSRAAWPSSGQPGSPTLTAGVAGSLAPTVRSLMATWQNLSVTPWTCPRDKAPRLCTCNA